MATKTKIKTATPAAATGGEPEKPANTKQVKTKAETAKPAKVSNPATRNELFYSKKRDRTEEDKMPRQMAQIFTCIADSGGEIARDALIVKMEACVQTRQPMARILSYYQPKLLAAGLVHVDRRAVPVQPSKVNKDEASEVDAA